MSIYNIETTDLEDKLLRLVMIDTQAWVDNILSVRAKDSLTNVRSIAANRYLDEGIQMPTTDEELVDDMLERGWIEYANNNALENR